MFSFLSEFLQKKEINIYAPLPLSACKIIKPYLLERANITDGTVLMIAVPYFTTDCLLQDRNVSAYAVSHDYHIFFEQLFDSLLTSLRAKYPQYRFAGFADHSPIDEIDAAAHAGLGIIGKNHLLITPQYSSYIFLGELITSAHLLADIKDIQYCENCGACEHACPTKFTGSCLSSLTQRKGVLSTQEQDQIYNHGSAWGCDICQAICPHTIKAIQAGTIFTPIRFFQTDPLPTVTTKRIQAMEDAEFSSRSYAWRGKNTILRNLKILEKKGDSPC